MNVNAEQNTEFKFVAIIYWLCLIFVGVKFFNEIDYLRYNITADKMLSILDFSQMLYLVYFPVIGLWCLKRGYAWGYIFLGAVLYYIEENFWYTFMHIID